MKRHPLFHQSAEVVALLGPLAWAICWVWYVLAPAAYARSSHQWLGSLALAIVAVWLDKRIRVWMRLIPASLPDPKPQG
jgi:hypothetical protein